MSTLENTPIILVAFGTSTRARDTYRHFEEYTRKAFPDRDIRWAYTSHHIRRKLKTEEGVAQQGLADVLDDLLAEGYKKAVAQSLHIVPGIAYDRLLADVAGHGLKVGVGRPLLSDANDVEKALDAIIPLLPNPDETVTILAGHGTDHPAASFYLKLAEAIRRRGLQNLFMGNVSGPLAEEEALEAARCSDLKHVHFIPFMFVAGDHIENDIMGDEEDSWKSRLPGKTCTIEQRGLGYCDKVADIFLQHLRDAMETL
ncbi:MAG: sirohydrochlorin cobaltochelatase [Nitrospirota bacterium]|nr:sirohydrochlorin cobaltochelatase [Nitrospirota bacterium]